MFNTFRKISSKTIVKQNIKKMCQINLNNKFNFTNIHKFDIIGNSLKVGTILGSIFGSIKGFESAYNDHFNVYNKSKIEYIISGNILIMFYFFYGGVSGFLTTLTLPITVPICLIGSIYKKLN